MRLQTVLKTSSCGFFLFLSLVILSTGQNVRLFGSLVNTVCADEIITKPLRPLDTFDIGLLTSKEGALPQTLWRNSSMSSYKSVIDNLVGLTESPTLERWVKRVLLSPAQAPLGAEKDDYAAFLRMKALFERGRVQNVIDLLRRTQRTRVSPALARLWAEALLSVGETEFACEFTENIPQGESLAFWLRLRSYCDALYNKIAAAELNAQLAEDTGKRDPVFNAFLLQMTGARERDGAVRVKDLLHWSLAKTLGISPTLGSRKRAKNEVLGGWLSDDEVSLENKIYAAEKLMSLMEVDLVKPLYKKVDLPDFLLEHFKAMRGFSKEQKVEDSNLKEGYQASPEESYKAHFYKTLEIANKRKGFDRQAAYFQIYPGARTIRQKAAVIASSLEHAEKIKDFYVLSRLYQNGIKNIPVHKDYRIYASSLALASLVNSDFTLAMQWQPFMDKKMKDRLAFLFFILGDKPDPEEIEKALLESKRTNEKQFKAAVKQVLLLSALGIKISSQSRVWIQEAIKEHSLEHKNVDQMIVMNLAMQNRALAETFLSAVTLLGKGKLEKKDILTVEQVVKALSALGYKKEAKALIIEYIIATATRYIY